MATVQNEEELVLTAREVAARVLDQGAEEEPGVHRTVLWEQEGSAAGVLQLDPGTRLGEHVHHDHVHHVWVLAGRARVQDRVLEADAYWFVPRGRSHTLEALAPEGCRLFYLYLSE